jgi:two-component sensor histidine kinase
LRPYRGEDDTRFTIRGPAVNLSPKRALALGMAFHELAINAAKYGALSNAQGRIAVEWRVQPGGAAVQLNWTETGGPRVVAPTAKGFGLRLIEQGLAREVSGTVHLALPPEGLACSWDIPFA